ncbi:DUF3289 family protein [Kosakonia sp. CCTCC M2018092]|uniref:DUF3289 family protein n=1 Tax=Kosakonia sp. CCTCC M2018092 TaxID=2492396 RepID=UPI000F61573B|nr:DUF3289 family protein [Kosakonia sp. CCTCC M2018092]AZI87207.1 DUF3289 family protein [Kosakonia sp. CCTCC M2018092]
MEVSVVALGLPVTIFATKRQMDHRSAADMKCGDLTEEQLKRDFRLTDVSTKVDPYKLEQTPTLITPRPAYYDGLLSGALKKGKTISRLECSNIMFDEMRSLSSQFAMYGAYRQLITKMITHWQTQNGAAFQDAALNMALRNQIINDSSEQSSLKAIVDAINDKVNYKDKTLHESSLYSIESSIQSSILPKFSRFKDNLNGLGITVHDIYAVNIKLISMNVYENKWQAIVKYTAQDHFGLDDEDIKKSLFFGHRFFRIWFVLQRYKAFGFKPFFTNMETVIKIHGGMFQ